MHRLEEKYTNELVVIGVHSGKFIAERETENIRAAAQRLGITHPVVNDRQFRTWRSFSVQAWPTVALVSPDGNYIGQHAGEFAFEQFDEIIGAVAEAYAAAGLLQRSPLRFAADPLPDSGSPLRFPGKVLAAPQGDRLFISDTAHNRVLVARVEEGARAAVMQVVGSGEAGFGDGPLAEATLDRPEGLAFEGDRLYIADTENHSIRIADLSSGMVTTLAGTGEIGYTRTGGKGTATTLNSPWDLLLRDGYLYIAMAGTHQLWRMDLKSGEVGPFAGSGRENIDDGPNPRATLAQPSGLTTDGSRILFADSESSAVRAADFSPDGYVQTLVGEGLFEFGDRDGKALQARLQHCLGVAYYGGKVYIADTYNNKIKLLDLAAKEVSAGYGSGDPSELYEPGGLSTCHASSGPLLYVADTNNHRILRFGISSEGALVGPEVVDVAAG